MMHRGAESDVTQFIHLLKWVVFLRSFDKWRGSSSSSDLTEDSTYISVRFSRGLELLGQSMVNDARQVFEDIIRENPEYALAHFGLGCVFVFEGLKDKGFEEWKKAIEIDPDCGEASFALAWAHYDMGDLERGYEYVGKAVESGRDLDNVREIVERFKGGGVPEIEEIPEPEAIESEPDDERKIVSETTLELGFEEKPVKVGIFQRIKSGIWNKERRIDILYSLLILIVCYVLLRGTLREGFPRAFLDGTMAFYLAKVKMLLNNFRFFTESWYFGFELLRFYPPLSAIIPYIAAVITGKPLLAYNIMSFIFYVLFCLGNYFFISRFLGSRPAGLFAGVAWALTHSNVVSFQGHYWEIARLGGSAAMPWFLWSLDKAIKTGKKWVILGVCLAAYTFLTNMYSVIDLFLFSLPFIITRGMATPIEEPPLRSSIGNKTKKILGIGFLGVAAFTFWWYLPAVLPYGTSGYLMGGSGVPPPFSSVFLQINPPDWMPATQLPVTMIGVLGLATFVRKRDARGMTFVSWLFLTAMLAYIIKIQSVRALPLISLSLVYLGSYFIYGFLDAIPFWSNKFSHVGRHDISTIVAVVLLLILLKQYMPIYSRYATVDDEYLTSDEYKTALWLKGQVGREYRVYVMYGNKFRGAQWLSTFTPETMQVLGGNDIGAFMVDNSPFIFDEIVKKGEDATELFNLANEYHVKYIVIDDFTMKDQGLAYAKFFEENYFEVEDEIDEVLSYAKIFEVKGVTSLPANSPQYYYWDNWRILGMAGTVVLIIAFIYSYRKITL